MDAVFTNLIDAASWMIGLANRVLPFTSRLNWLYLLTTAAVAVGVALATHQYDPKKRLRSLWAFVAPRAIWLHPSSILDYKVAVLGKVIERFLLSPLLLSSLVVGQLVAGWLATIDTTAIVLPSPWVEITYTVATLLLADLSFYVVHRLAHRVPVLWEFHKAHHSAEVMTPITYLREHPMDQVLQVTAAALFVGPLTGAYMHFFPEQMTVIKVLGLNVGTFVWFLFASNLRHSHVWLPYGRVLDRIFSSPAQHQIHHSDNRAHYDTNYGSIFSIWDWAFGTLLAPIERPAGLRFGLSGVDTANYRTLVDFYVRPIRNALDLLRGAPATMANRTL